LSTIPRMTKYIFVTGGVLSGLGKGVTAASIGNILKARGYTIFMQKLDQYLNVDAGTLNPGQHGECYVTEDGLETDLDLGHYERFIDISLNKYSYITTGGIYSKVLENERKGKYLGKTIQVVPHVINEIKRIIKQAAKSCEADVLISEIGGTVGDMEGMHFLEAVRQMRRELGANNVLFFHVSYLPQLGTTKDLKTKPTQHSVREMRELGIQPDFIGCRADKPIGREEVEKIALFCDVEKECVMRMETASNIYEVPLLLERQNLGALICKKLDMVNRLPDFRDWERTLEKIRRAKKKITIAMVCKYMEIKDTYLSVLEALDAAGWANDVKVYTKWIDGEKLESLLDPSTELGDAQGILVPGGFGSRGVEGKIMAIKYAREHKIPFLGLCYGMQLAAVEFARNVCHLKDANTTECDPDTTNPIIYIMPEQRVNMEEENYGASMRLGSYPCIVTPDTKTYKAYGAPEITERHRHRFEFNQDYTKQFAEKGMIISGISPNGKLVEMLEIVDHPWFVGTQAHPELKSRPHRPHPLFKAFIKASVEHSS